MATSSKPDKNDSRKTEKTGRRSDDPKTDRFPAFQKPIDEFFTNWPDEADNDAAGDR